MHFLSDISTDIILSVSDKKSITYSLIFENLEKTLTDEEINKAISKILEGLKEKLNAELRD